VGEETKDPEINAPKGIVNSVILSCVASFLFMIVILYNLGGEDD